MQNHVFFAGNVPNDDLSRYYNAADIYVSTSLSDGTSLSLLEAIACGCPVIASNASSIPEVVGDAGIMVDPYDVDNLAKTIYKVLTSEGLRETMIEKGLKRAKQFNWEKVAKEILGILEEVI